jgi:hypothetical protein
MLRGDTKKTNQTNRLVLVRSIGVDAMDGPSKKWDVYCLYRDEPFVYVALLFLELTLQLQHQQEVCGINIHEEVKKVRLHATTTTNA